MFGAAATTIAIGGAGALGVLAYGAFHPQSSLFGSVLWRGSRDRSEVALTFDDGPMPGVTDAILDALREARATATFFVIGRHAEAHPALVRRAYDEGHIIGNHTLDHHRYGLLLRDAYWRDQIEGCGRVIEEIIGARPRFFRPPMGFTSAHVARAVRWQGCTTVTWSRRGLDTVVRSPGAIARRTLDGLEAGEIAALHDGIDDSGRRAPDATPGAVRLILAELRERRLLPVGLDKLLNIEPYTGS